MPSPGQVKTTHLNPVLKSALACLDLNLDTELRRYRRACRKLGKVLSPPSHAGGITLPQQSLIDLKSITDFIPLEKPAEERTSLLVAFDRNDTSQGSQSKSSEGIDDRGSQHQESSQPHPSEHRSVATLVYQNPKDLTPPPPPEPPTDYLRSSEQLLESIYDQDSPPSPQGSTGEQNSSLHTNPFPSSPSPITENETDGEEKQHNWSEEIFTPLGFSAIALAIASGGLLAWSLLVPPRPPIARK
ncbi:MAG: hypothetical protein HC796_11410 [Synechococcaceae cyanobacterium RL_1_2]|nr:hypothetical protein [Synechococcaceae cyanobacterium RL_1_2]